MKKILPLLLLLVSFNTFAFSSTGKRLFGSAPTDSDSYEKAATIPNLEKILDEAEDNSTVIGRKILETSRIMITNQEIVLGSCWDYINAIYNRAGHPSKFRVTTYKSKLQGPYVEPVKLEGGDWLYFVNHSYNNVEHSGIFVGWTNLAKKEALIISYAGGNQAKPARYKVYDLSSVYNIIKGR